MLHEPVLLQEVSESLKLQPGEVVVDATVNRGGHSRVLSSFLGSSGHLIGIDADSSALVEARQNLSNCECKVTLINGNFANLDELLGGEGVIEVDAILFDLGLSSNQLEWSDRGFSFQRDEPLLMTFASNPEADQLTATNIVNSWSESELTEILFEYGEERFARQIAKAIVLARRHRSIQTTSELVEIIRGAVPVGYTHARLHFATKTFQALRIATNDELNSLSSGLAQAWSRLRIGGRLAVISFHSLEARIVKNFFTDKKQAGLGELVNKKAIKPTRTEILQNPRSRSAQLRVIKKLK